MVFVGRLNDEQRRSFMALATKMALADAKVQPEEVLILEDFTSVFGSDVKIPGDEVYGPTNVEAFDTLQSRKIALLGMLAVAYSDSHFHVDESTVLSDTAALFELDGQELHKMKTWAQRAAALFRDFHEMVDVEGTNDATE